MPTAGSRAPYIDREALHRLLFRRADRKGSLRLKVKDLAEELDLGYCNLVTVVNDMAEEGRLRRIGGRPFQQATYYVLDPQIWAAAHRSPLP
jgi:hypothetical protein